MHSNSNEWPVRILAILTVIVLLAVFRPGSVPTAAGGPLAYRPPPEDDTGLSVILWPSTPTPLPIISADSTDLIDRSRLPAASAAATAVPVLVSGPAPTAGPVLSPTAGIPLPAAPTPPPGPRTANVPILMYHYISDPPAGSDKLRVSLSVPPTQFDAQLALLQKAGFQTITLDDLYENLAGGKPLPPKPIILTFDDGYEDHFTQAAPILLSHGYVGTFFVMTGPADRGGDGRYLTWPEIEAMNAAGMDIELHSREHFELRNRPNDFLVHHIAGARQTLQAHLNRPIRWFAYPSGSYDAAVVRVLKSDGFWGAVTTVHGSTHTAGALFDMPRIRMSGSYSLDTFAKLLGIR